MDNFECQHKEITCNSVKISKRNTNRKNTMS